MIRKESPEALMTETILLVDFENVAKVDPKAITAGFRVMVFFGSTDKNMPIEIFDAAGLPLIDKWNR